MTEAVESVADFGPDEAAKCRRWIAELDASEKFWKPYLKRCKTILKRYEDERTEEQENSGDRRFNIYYSNIETLKPACYTNVPQAVVLRRWNDQDKVARVSAEVLERAVNFSQDCYDFDQVIKDCRDEFLLLAKGQAWVRYVPTFKPAPQSEGVQTEAVSSEEGDAPQEKPPEPEQVVAYEEAVCDHVSYEDWGTNKCRKWSEVRYVYRKCYMDRAALKKRFTKVHEGTKKTVGELIPLDRAAETGGEGDGDVFAQATIYEIWDKVSKTAIWLSKSFNSTLLDERPDPLKLKGFFPCPKPAMGSTSPRSIIPIPDYVQYQDQCREMDDLTGRIAKLTDALVLAGVYAGDQKDTLENLLDPKNSGKIIPIEGWQAFAERGGLKGLIEYTPIEAVYNVLKGLYEAREVCKSTIYEITGIPDIMRGESDADETATAQGIKSKFGSNRVREKQKEMARFARDIMRLQGELIAGMFGIETLKIMTNMKLLMQAEKKQVIQYQQAVAQIQQQAQAQQQMMAQQAPQGQPGPGGPPQQAAPQAPPPQIPPPPFPQEWMALMDLPTWEEVDQLLKSDGALHMRVDIEADSTVEPDLISDRKDAAEYLTAMGSLLTGALPVVMQMPPLAKPIGKVIQTVTRKFNLGREVEEEWEKAMLEIAGMPPQQQEPEQKGKSPEELAIEQQKVMVAGEQVKVAMAKVQQEGRNSEFDAQTNAADAKANLERVAMEERNARMDKMMERMLAYLDADTRTREAKSEQDTRLAEATIDADTRRYEADKAAEAAASKQNGKAPA